MPHAAVGELLAGLVEVGLEVATGGDNNKKSGVRCFIFLIGVIIIGVFIYCFAFDNIKQTKGLITKKLPHDKILIKTTNGEDVYTITHELYLNKSVGDSIILKK